MVSALRPPDFGAREWLLLLGSSLVGCCSIAIVVAGDPSSAVAMVAISGSIGLLAAGGDSDVAELIGAVERVADGDYDVSFELDRDDELGQLADALDELVESVERREDEFEREIEYTAGVLDALDDVFYVLDRSADHRQWNDTLAEVTGYDHGRIAELHPLEYFEDEDEQRIAAGIDEAFETGNARVEAALTTADGDEIPYEWIATRLTAPDGSHVVAGTGRDVSERIETERRLRERERELQRTKYLLRQGQQLAHVGGWELDVSSEPYSFEGTEEFYSIHGVPQDAAFDVDEILEFYHPDDRDHIRELLTAAIEEGASYDMEVRLATEAPDERWIRAIAEPVIEGGEIVALRGSIQDITDRKEQELTLQSLHDVAIDLLEAESREEVATVVLDAVSTVLGVSCIGVYLFDEHAGRLEPVARTESFEEHCREPDGAYDADGAPVLWDAYVGGETLELDESARRDSTIVTDDAHSVLLVPIGEHGVLLAAQHRGVESDGGRDAESAEDRAPEFAPEKDGESVDGVDADDRRLIETLVAKMATVLRRLDSEAALRENQTQLEAQNQRLRRQMQITEIIRRVDRSLVGASTREEIESAVCERLVESDDVAFAWIGTLDERDEALVPRAWAGTGHEYLDAISLDASADAPDPAVTAAVTGEPALAESVVEQITSEAWRKHALVWDFSSVLAVPLELEEYSYGALAVYGPDPGAFGDLERTVFEELGESIANAINAVEARRALYADEFVELRLRFDGEEDFLGRIAAASGATVEYVGLATHAEDESRLFFETSGVEPATVRGVLDDLHTVGAYRQIGEDTDPTLFEATVAGTVLATRLVDRGGVPRSMVASDGDLDVVVDVPTTIDVREFLEMLREWYRSIDLLGRQNVHRDVQTRQELVAGLFDDLTERQLEVLRTAFFAGFFEWPRESTGEDVAELLDVSQPTVNRHLRHGLARLLQQLFEEEPTAVAPA